MGTINSCSSQKKGFIWLIFYLAFHLESKKVIFYFISKMNIFFSRVKQIILSVKNTRTLGNSQVIEKGQAKCSLKVGMVEKVSE